MSAPLLATWKDRAACRDTYLSAGADPFYPEGSGNGHSYDAARRICAGCPVRQACLDDAIERRDGQGFRAGLTPVQLRTRIKDVAPEPSEAQKARVAALTHGSQPGQTARGEATRKRIAELALAGMGATKIAAEMGLSSVTVYHHLKDLRERSVIPVTAGTAGVTGDIEHGTKSGYSKHRREKTKPCRVCLDAANAYERERRAIKKAMAS
jgi:WhiB family redox-sensing transcriptional regulator